MKLLEARAISKVYGSLAALDGVDLYVRANEFHGLIGPNGSGKSTLLKCIAGAEFATSGSIVLAGQDITRATSPTRSRAGLSLKFQITAIFPELSVYDNVLLSVQAGESMAAQIFSSSRRRLDEKVMAFLERFRLDDRRDDLAGVLSHGQQQWLEIAIALAREPKVLLLDEPTAGMSPQERRATGELLAPIRSHCSLLIVEHDLDFIRDICDSLTVLDQGRVVATGSTAEVQKDERVKEAYLANV
ncbi:MAG: ATP-binding cassette domain-containing protein [Betaproteobacteria bacterium]|nr:ATP-binding cassette domain-containing protein [Betaproteobacteria bacterium]